MARLSQSDDRKRQLKRRYGMTPEQYDELFAKQNGVCGICGGREDGQHLCVDHCHDTKIIRGLLCGKCNRGLGNFDHDVHLLLQAVSYLHHRQK
jgi:hypothetical protein